MKKIIKWFKKLHLHKWEYSRYVTILDIFPPLIENYKTPTRVCRVCSKQEYWLPGYGGSEVGCCQPNVH